MAFQGLDELNRALADAQQSKSASQSFHANLVIRQRPLAVESIDDDNEDDDDGDGDGGDLDEDEDDEAAMGVPSGKKKRGRHTKRGQREKRQKQRALKAFRKELAGEFSGSVVSSTIGTNRNNDARIAKLQQMLSREEHSQAGRSVAMEILHRQELEIRNLVKPGNAGISKAFRRLQDLKWQRDELRNRWGDVDMINMTGQDIVDDLSELLKEERAKERIRKQYRRNAAALKIRPKWLLEEIEAGHFKQQ